MDSMLELRTPSKAYVEGVGAALHSMIESPFVNGRRATEAEAAAFLPLSDSVMYDDLAVGDVVFMHDPDDNVSMVGFMANTTDATPDEGVFYKQVVGDDGEPDMGHHADVKVLVVARCPDRGRK